MTRSSDQILAILHARGATRLRVVRLRRNRRTIWSLTAGGRALNLHRAFAGAPAPVLEDLAVIARTGHVRSEAARAAAERVASWRPVREAMRRLRRETLEGKIRAAREGRPLPACCGTEDQRRYLRRLYRWYNRTRFDGFLPDPLPLRFSSRMRRRLGHLRPGPGGEVPTVSEIALNVDLMLPENDGLREDTLLHEMAHAADYLVHGALGHGPTWREWARRAGCEPRACTARDFRRRGPGRRVTTRVPSLPSGAGGTAEAGGV